VIEKTRATVELAKHGNLKINSITGMLSEVFYSTIAAAVSRDTVGIVMLTIERRLGYQTMNGLVGR